mmetsp:Transcript_47917/g.115192  ORF Transcript_47917/g.115192 Transcript_47917/m.115192 type:complete len:557 (+) Transcript_47917:23-1693(+)
MKLIAFAAFSALVAASAAAPLFEAPGLPAEWAVKGAAAAQTPHRVTLALARQNVDRMERMAQAVSDPFAPEYTNYMTVQEIKQVTSVPASVAAVSEWLTAAGFTFTVAPTGTSVEITATTSDFEALFDTTFQVLHKESTGQKAMRAGDVTLPAEVAEHVEAVFGVHGLPLPPRRNHDSDVEAGTPANVTPDVIAQTYNVSGVTPAGTTANRQAIVEFQGQLLSQSDLTQFFQSYVKNAKAGDDKVFKYVGDQQQGNGVEANLDVQYIMGVAAGVKTEAWQYAGQDFCGDLKQWTQQIISTQNPPNVFSVSYGWQGDMSQIGCSTSQIQSIDQDFKTITATGISIIFASGDSGSGYNSFFGFDPKLYSSWPASSMYVTAVGATRFINQQPGDGEQAVDQFGSGGGFSRIVTPAPAWQSAGIKTFYSEETNAPQNKSTYGYGGRGTPDVAALGEGYQVVISGSVQSVGGTSAAAPCFAGLVSLANDARIQAGKKPLGNLNAWIYQNTGMFRDVTVGNDRISRSGSTVPLGFDCEAGWDPVTGWGTVDFPKFLSNAMSK